MPANKLRISIIVLAILIILFLVFRHTSGRSSESSIGLVSASSTPLAKASSHPEQKPVGRETHTPDFTANSESSNIPSVKASAKERVSENAAPQKSMDPTNRPDKKVDAPKVIESKSSDPNIPGEFIKPTVSFTNSSCQVLEQEIIYRYEVNFIGGDNYYHDQGYGFNRFQLKVMHGKFWSSWGEIKDTTRYSGYRIRSEVDRSWTWFSAHHFKKGEEYEQTSPYRISDLVQRGNPDVYFQPPYRDFSICKP